MFPCRKVRVGKRGEGAVPAFFCCHTEAVLPESGEWGGGLRGNLHGQGETAMGRNRKLSQKMVSVMARQRGKLRSRNRVTEVGPAVQNEQRRPSSWRDDTSAEEGHRCCRAQTLREEREITRVSHGTVARYLLSCAPLL